MHTPSDASMQESTKRKILYPPFFLRSQTGWGLPKPSKQSCKKNVIFSIRAEITTPLFFRFDLARGVWLHFISFCALPWSFVWQGFDEIFPKSPFSLCAPLKLDNIGAEFRSRRCVILCVMRYGYQVVLDLRFDSLPLAPSWTPSCSPRLLS